MTEAASAAAEISNPRKDLSTRFSATRQPVKTGRPKQAKDRLTREFWNALADDFVEHGKKAIALVRQEDPSAYLRVCASVIPKEIDIRTDSADPDRLEAQLSLLEAIIEERRAAKDITATVQVIGNADD